ncbi:hypothetical protein NliqN6_6613 [Naganishia liquefaciens]|uniref:RTA1 domain-containing protein n=1 Tax=Naganishia liquefaciens TaxID=104408 RepID=A0A8H3TYX5_9TREE|nr:hypothetical protein NliqN6_6613 [Naganishia liquefaciens]
MAVTVTDPDTQGLFGFIPNLALAVIGLILYAVPMFIFIANWFRHGRQRYMLALVIGSFAMVVGWGCRVAWHYKPGSTAVYIPQTLFILLSPCAFIANNYIILPRLATHLGEERCLFIKSRIIVRLFVWSDIVTFLFQAAGGGMASAGGSIASTGETISLVGLIAQACSFTLFTLLLTVFGMKIRKAAPEKWHQAAHERKNGSRFAWRRDWTLMYRVLLATCAGYLVRSFFRIAEYAQGYFGYLATHEGYFYALDALPIFLCIACFTVFWPPIVFDHIDRSHSYQLDVRSNSGISMEGMLKP